MSEYRPRSINLIGGPYGLKMLTIDEERADVLRFPAKSDRPSPFAPKPTKDGPVAYRFVGTCPILGLSSYRYEEPR